jgi:RimJ/RimL family protein N-acetyltransferase
MSTEGLAPGLQLPGGRALLEPLTLDHSQGLLEAVDDPLLWRYMPAATPTTVDQMRAVTDAALTDPSAYPFAVIDRSSGRPCGSTRYLEINPANKALEIGWTWYSRRAQRTSINTECKLLLLGYAFENMGCIRVQLRCDLRNLASQAAIERIGGVKEGVFRRHRIMWDGYIRDSVFYSILDAEWPAVKQKLQDKLAGHATPR